MISALSGEPDGPAKHSASSGGEWESEGEAVVEISPQLQGVSE